MSDDKRRNFEKSVRESVSKYSRTGGNLESARAGGGPAIAPLDVARDRSVPAIERAAALHAIAPAQRNDAEFIQTLFGLAGDSSEPAELRSGVLRILRQLRFSSVRLNENRAKYIETLRPLVDEPDPTLRQDALEMLAQEKDEYVQRRLLESLSSGAPLAGSLEKTVQLLGYDIHAEHYPVLRRIATEAPGADARREAVRLLASDPQSIGLLKKIFRDRNEDQQVRRASGNGYLSLDPQGFEQEAKAVVFDQGEDEDVRAASLSALTHFAHPSVRDAELNEYVESMEKRPLSKPLEDAVKTYRRRPQKD
jgi:hypothetical protein